MVKNKLDSIEELDFDNILQESNDSVSPLEFNTPEKKKKLVPFLVTVLVIGLLAGVAYPIYGIVQNNLEAQKQEQLKQEEAQRELEKQKAIRESSLPLSILVGEIPEPTEGPLVANVVNEHEIVAGDLTMVASNASFTASQTECKVNLNTDYCFVAHAKHEDTFFTVYLFKQIAQNRLFENPDGFVEHKFDNANVNAIAAIMDLPLGPNKKLKVSPVTKDGNTGFLFMFEGDITNDVVTKVLNDVTLK